MVEVHNQTASTDPHIDVNATTTGTRVMNVSNPCQVCSVRDMAFCGVLDNAELDRLDSISSRFHVSPPKTIVFEADQADFVFNVTEGVVRLTKMLADGRRQITGFLFPGDFIGMTGKDTYVYSAEAVTAVDLCRFPRLKLMNLFEESPELEHRMLSMAYDDLAMAQEQILLLGRKTARERLASFLLMLMRQAERRRRPADSGAVQSVMLPMSRADIADYLGLTIETVSRTMTRLSKDGLIGLTSAHEAVLKDVDALAAIETGEDER